MNNFYRNKMLKTFISNAKQSLIPIFKRKNNTVPKDNPIKKSIDVPSNKDEILEKEKHQKYLAYMHKELAENKMDLDITYPINPPFVNVNIIFDKFDGEFRYIIKEPQLLEEEKETLKEIKKRLESTMEQEKLPIEDGKPFSESDALKHYIEKRFDTVIDLYDIKVPDNRKAVLLFYLEKDLIGLGRSDSVIKDLYVEDIGCNGPQIPLYIYHRVFGSMKTNVIYTDELELNRFILKLAQTSGKHISVYQPILDAILQDGSRINLTLGSEVTRKGSTFTIRKFSHNPISPIDLLRFGSTSAFELAYFWELIDHKKSILLSGGTASGKTTMLNALCNFIRPEDKIVSIEDTPEIHIDHENWIQSVSRKGYGKITGGSGDSPGTVDLYDLLVAALRQRPEYVIVGEIRGKEAFTLFQAISVGHASMSTVHAGSISELVHRVENEPMNIPRVLFQSLDVAVFIGQVHVDGRRVRRVKNVMEVLEIESGSDNLLTNRVFEWDPRSDSFFFSGRSFIIEKIAKETGKDKIDIINEIKRKAEYIKLMNDKNLIYYKDVNKAINMYYVDSETAFKKLKER